MRITRIAAASACAAALVAAGPAAAEDLTVVYQLTGGGQASTVTDYFARTKIRIATENGDVITDTAAGRIVTIDHKRREYSEMTMAEMEAALKKGSDQLSGARAKQEEALQKMPPEMRARMEKMMGGMGGAMAVSVTRGAGTRRIAGYACEQYVVSLGPVKTDVWTTTALQPSIDPGEMLRLQSALSPAARSLGNAMEEMKKVRGFTLASHTTMSLMGRATESTKEATEVKTGPIPDSAFAIPAGYKRVDSPMAKLGR
jgi:hypothetical protein